MFVSSMSSPSADFMTPIFPDSAPARDLLKTRARYDFDSPNKTVESVRPRRPMQMTGFLPMVSDNRPHRRIIVNSAKKNIDS